jgi:hypothetical protein
MRGHYKSRRGSTLKCMNNYTRLGYYVKLLCHRLSGDGERAAKRIRVRNTKCLLPYNASMPPLFQPEFPISTQRAQMGAAPDQRHITIAIHAAETQSSPESERPPPGPRPLLERPREPPPDGPHGLDGGKAALTAQTMDEACHTYFLGSSNGPAG